MTAGEPFARAACGLLDTSVLIAAEAGRPLALDRLPAESVLSVVTLAELRAGVLLAADADDRARRLATLESVNDIAVLEIDDAVATAWARLRVALRVAGRRMGVNDLWIAATAVAHAMPVVTQDEDFAVLDGILGLDVLRV